MDAPVIIFQTSFASEKEEVQTLLKAAGIEVVASQEAPAGDTPERATTRLLIDSSNAEKAEKILWEKGFL